MNFDRTSQAPCIVQPAPTPDPRCDDSAFALANPGVCPNQLALIIRPAVSLFCQLDSVRFRVFAYQNGTETELTSGVTFETSNAEVFAVGVNSGSGTALSAGIANITATYAGKSIAARATVSNGTGSACCNDLVIASAIAVDNSRSMTLSFGGQYATRLTFAKAVALVFGSNLLFVDNVAKDRIKVWSFNAEPTEELPAFTSEPDDIVTAIAGISQTQQKTDLLDVFTTIADDILAEEVNRRVIVIVTDGEHSIDTNTQAVIDASTLFKDGGGIVIIVGTRASGVGYDFLQRLATPGFFLNATEDNIDETIAALNFIKSSICAGTCIPTGNEFLNVPELEYSSFLNWQVLQGQVNLVGPGLLDMIPGNGLYVDMAAGSKAIIRSTDSFALYSGRNYRISFNLAGNQREAIAGQGIKVYVREVGINDSDPNIFETVIYGDYTDGFHNNGFVFPMLYDATVRIYFEQLGTAANPACGNLLDTILFQDFTTLTTLLSDNFDDENLRFVEPACGPSSAIVPISDPEEPEDEAFTSPGSDVWNGESYRYAVSYLTPEGETALSDAHDVATSVIANKGTRILFLTPPSNVIAVRIWRSIEDAGTDLWLLANLNPADYTSFEDTETHAQFLARFDASITSPATNTTGKTEGELGVGHSYCCYYATEPVDTSDLISAIPEMTSDTEPSGVASSNSRESFDGTPWYSFGGNPTQCWTALDESIGSVYIVPVYIQYEFPQAVTIRRYSMVIDEPIPYFSLKTAKAWEFQGSNNGSSWTVLDTRSGQTAWTSLIFNIASPQSFKFYRLSITESNHEGYDVSGGTFLVAYPGQIGMFASVTNEVTTYTNNCPECSNEPAGEQVQDSDPLPDIEKGFTPPTIYTSTKSRCAACVNDTINLSSTPLAFGVVDSDLGPPITCDARLTAGAAILAYYRLGGFVTTGGTQTFILTAFRFQGSNDGSTWTTLDEQAELSFYPGEYKRFLLSGNSAYDYYRLYVVDGSAVTPLGPDFNLFPGPAQGGAFFAAVPNQVCSEATATSTVSQADADAKANAAALEAATEQLTCVAVYTATESAIAKCPTGSLGNTVTKSATRQSLVSHEEAVNSAHTAAQAAADAELVCTLSNNTQNITINDAASTLSKATPYPSVKYVSGLSGVITKVTVTLTGITHNSPDDIGILLRSPTGTLVCLMRNVGGVPPGSSGTANVNLVLDGTSGSFLPDANPLVSGTFKPKGYGTEYDMPELPVSPYGTLLSAFNGENPNGSWAIFVVDDLTAFAGVISGGWDLTITMA